MSSNKLYQARFRASESFLKLAQRLEEELNWPRSVILQEAYKALEEKVKKEKLVALLSFDQLMELVREQLPATRSNQTSFLDNLTEEEEAIWVKKNLK